MMELGALVCTPKNPLCLFCPVQDNCSAFKEGTVLDLPVKLKHKEENDSATCVLLRNAKGEYLIEQRQERLLNGMWQFPMFEAPNTLEQLENKLGMSLSIAEEIVFKLKHQFTHMTWDISVFSVIETASLSKNDGRL